MKRLTFRACVHQSVFFSQGPEYFLNCFIVKYHKDQLSCQTSYMHKCWTATTMEEKLVFFELGSVQLHLLNQTMILSEMFPHPQNLMNPHTPAGSSSFPTCFSLPFIQSKYSTLCWHFYIQYLLMLSAKLGTCNHRLDINIKYSLCLQHILPRILRIIATKVSQLKKITLKRSQLGIFRRGPAVFSWEKSFGEHKALQSFWICLSKTNSL